MATWSGKKIVSTATRLGKRLYKSVWFFPIVLAIPLIIFTAFGIHGSSVGTYHDILYGKDKDSHVLANEARAIRSDEWLVNTQKTIAQAENGFPLVNKNLGQGENMSVIVDVPYKEWSVVFKPHNLGFFVLPLDNAFAFRWWAMGYLLIVSCYFFVLALLPKRRLLAASLGLALFFSAFVQWWYLYGTLASLYYPLFIAATVMLLCKQKQRWKRLALGGVLTYLIACFAIVLYPPFQVACGLVLLAFLVGYFFENYSKWGKQQTLLNVAHLAVAGIVAAVIVLIFVFTRMDVVKTANNTVYPGKRIAPSGHVQPLHFMSSQLGHQFTSEKNTGYYLIDGKNVTNQSEGANFLLLLPFLFVPAVGLLVYEYRRKMRIDRMLLALLVVFILFLIESFSLQFTTISRFFLLDKVGGPRLLIGMGLLNIVMFAVIVRNLSKKDFEIPRKWVLAYSGLVLAIVLAINLRAHWEFDHFISFRGAVLFALPLPLIIYLLLRKRFAAAAVIYAVFSIFISAGVNPLYKGLSTLTSDPLSTAVEDLGRNSDKKWVSEGGYLQHAASINGEPSLSGVYDYPQLKLWKDIPGASETIYNRYAHVGFQVSDDPTTKTSLNLITPDSFVVKTSACSDYLRRQDVGFVITPAVLKNDCLEQAKTIPYPNVTLYIYRLK